MGDNSTDLVLYQVSVSVHVYFEMMMPRGHEPSEEEVEDAYWSTCPKYATVDMRTANFADVTVYDEVEGT